jgi:NADH dehydrogenase
VVRIAVRDPEAAAFLKPAGQVGQIVPLRASVVDAAEVARAVEGARLVVNLVGILAEREEGEFERVHAGGAANVARAAAAAGVERVVHISALGADNASPSLYAASKWRGEEAVRAAFPRATILRPSIVFGPEDAFFNRFAAMARLLPVMPVICGDTRFQPVYVGDVADAVVAASTREDAVGATFELGGPAVSTFRALLAWILKEVSRPRPLLEVPLWLAELQARLAERLPGKPFTRDQLLLLQRDNVVTTSMPGLRELGVVPTPYELIVPKYLARYRPGGDRRAAAPAANK